MPATTNKQLYLLCGSEEYLVKESARRLIESLRPKDSGDFSVDIIDGLASNAAEAATAVNRTIEALNTLGFFSSDKLVWLKDANFFGTDKTSKAEAAVSSANDLAAMIKKGLPAGVTLVISANEVDKRRGFFLACDKQGEVQEFSAIDTSRRGWEGQVTDFIIGHARAVGKVISRDAIQRLIELNGANLRQIENEIEKIATYVGDHPTIEAADVRKVGSPSRDAIAWDLSDAVGKRDLRGALHVLDRLLFQGENAIGLLFMLASRFRQLLILRELMDRKLLQPARDMGSVEAQLRRLPANVVQELPADKSLNPAMQHPYRVLLALGQAVNYTRVELIRAMSGLLETNHMLVSSGLPDRLVLEEFLARVITSK